jgi:DNA uptake protein ComE-like DNA-binding protein
MRFSLFMVVFSAAACSAATLPDGPGKAATIRVCGKCHSPEKAATLHQDRSQWEDTIGKMIKLGAQGSDEEFESVLAYLSKNFAPETPGPIYVNRANVVDLETSLLLNRSEAKAVVEYRLVNGDFKSFADLEKVPGLDLKKLEGKKNRIIF